MVVQGVMIQVYEAEDAPGVKQPGKPGGHFFHPAAVVLQEKSDPNEVKPAQPFQGP